MTKMTKMTQMTKMTKNDANDENDEMTPLRKNETSSIYLCWSILGGETVDNKLRHCVRM